MVAQNAKRYGIQFGARIDLEMYKNIFSRRLAGERLLIHRGMESQFFHHAEYPEEREIGDLIDHWHRQQIPQLQEELKKQELRYNQARKTLSTKSTKKAESDLRISSEKMIKLTREIDLHTSPHSSVDSESRIFPLHFASMVCADDHGNRVVRPVRYLIRPHSMDAHFDSKYNGCYNARFDGLDSVPWWKDCLGKRHGVILIRQFYENISRVAYLRQNTITTPHAHKENVVVCFEPTNDTYMIVPVLWDYWGKNDDERFYSAALITDTPRPEMIAVGHDRTPIVLSPEGGEEWLRSVGSSATKCKAALMQRNYPQFGHTIV
jgi:putative SOS response-associated peptidase YedK